MITSFRSRMNKRAEYRRTLAELSCMPDDVARDLNIDRADMHRIAWQAVYGQ
jgi:uncharacterized protein YjiS (DUF1127 family)